MGVSMSTLGGWAILVVIGGFYAYHLQKPRATLKVTPLNKKIETRQAPQPRKENKTKRQRAEAYNKDANDVEKVKARAAANLTTPSTTTHDYSTDDGVDNRAFAKELAKTRINNVTATSKKNDEKKTRSVKQSRAQEVEQKPVELAPISSPSSTAGMDADDDQSSIASPEVQAIDVSNVADMLEAAAPGPSVLRLTDTDKVKEKKKVAKPVEEVETKKQRQNRKKAEALKAERAIQEEERKIQMEAQRRRAREAEGRAAMDGSGFMAAQAAGNAWTGSAVNGQPKAAAPKTNGSFLPVQPLDTFDAEVPKPSAPPAAKSKGWMNELPSEEEQMQKIRQKEEDDSWSEVKTKKVAKTKKASAAGGDSATESASEAKPQEVIAAYSPPVDMASKTSFTAVNGKKPAFTHQSSYAALSTNDEPVEEEWDV